MDPLPDELPLLTRDVTVPAPAPAPGHAFQMSLPLLQLDTVHVDTYYSRFSDPNACPPASPKSKLSIPPFQCKYSR